MKLKNNDINQRQLCDTVTSVDRSSYYKFEDTFQEYSPRPQHVLKWVARKYCAPFRSADSFGRTILDFFPVLKWLPAYSWRENFFYDLISGITTGVMFVPQGIAYSYLAGVAPVYGLYSSFFAPFFYILLGCSPHVSRGPSSVLGIMSGVSNEQIRSNYAEDLAVNSALNSTASVFDELATEPPDAITVAATLTFTIGLIQLGMGLARLEFAADYFSEALVGGYTLAAAIHVLISQMGSLLEISLQKGSTPGYLFKMAYDLITRLFDANLVSTMVSAFGIVFLLVGKDVLNPWINRKSRIKISLPYELMLMIMATVGSQCFDWSSQFHIKVVGEVPRGLPTPSAPRLDLIVYSLPNAAAIAMVTLAMHFSMVKLFAGRMHYTVDSAQELYAIGLGSILSGCFPVYPTSTALGRSLVMVESGAKSQLSTGISCVLVLTVILWFGPLFRPLPQCVLSVVVVVALRPIFRKAPEIIHIWKLSRYDGVIWIVSLVATVMTNVITGLCIAIVFTLFTVIFRTQWPVWSSKFSRCSFTTDAHGNESKSTPSNRHFADYCVFRFDSPLLFTNAQRFEKYVGQTLRRWRLPHGAMNGNFRSAVLSEKYRLFVFDLASTTQIDVAGLTALRKSVTMIIREKHALRVAFVNCHESIRESLAKAEIVTNIDDDFFCSLTDALRAFRKLLRHPSLPSDQIPTGTPLAIPEPFVPKDYDTSVASMAATEALTIRQSALQSSPSPSHRSADDAGALSSPGSCSCSCSNCSCYDKNAMNADVADTSSGDVGQAEGDCEAANRSQRRRQNLPDD